MYTHFDVYTPTHVQTHIERHRYTPTYTIHVIKSRFRGDWTTSPLPEARLTVRK